MDDLAEFIEFMNFIFVILCASYAFQLLKVKKRRFWLHDLFKDRNSTGYFNATFKTLKTKYPDKFWQATRMKPTVFDCLHNLLKTKLEKDSIRAISSECRLFFTLIYLAHGVSRQYLSLTFKMSVETIRRIVLETCSVIWSELHGIYLSPPNRDEWERIAFDFENMWDLPNCVGAIDGKHVAIVCPAQSGSTFYSYKGTFSIVLLAVCDANYTFTAVDIGGYGSQSDGGVFKFSQLGRQISTGDLDLPPRSALPNSDVLFPHYLVGDAAFPLKPYLMRPYPGTLISDQKFNYNKRLSRERRCIENAFGILTERWRILRGTLNMHPSSAERVVCATVVLHNYLKMMDGSYCPRDFVDQEVNGAIKQGLWRKETKPLRNISRFLSNNSARSTFQLRDTLSAYLFHNKI